VLAFLVRDLDRVLAGIYASLKPGGALAVMEYLTLETAACSPRIRGFDAHTQAWIRYYAKHGGDTSIGACLPARLERAGFEITYTNEAGGVARPGDAWWNWWGRLMSDFGGKLVSEGLMSARELEDLYVDWEELSRDGEAFIRTPVLLQLVGRKT
jgi:hypothetical protein